ncbi:constitutive coactivator of PPAR-gamma-like protein 1 homolog [Babylonia areolata]|uniref:constitutive coactivator of PPAR-gamma-like protein 1 homolog n=1 Tax=Babylonia areolata TaxID=304850 RepID=UPI003FD003C5
MGIADLGEYLENECSSACVSVDLLKIARGFVPPKRGVGIGGNGRFCLVVDGECCLDRLYGGYFSDWVCGGQFNRMTAFLSNFTQAGQAANMELVVMFNGALEKEKIGQWLASQLEQKEKVRNVFRHIANRGTPPPKVWWSPPVFVQGALRMALSHLGVTIASSIDDHNQEVIGFCREHNLQGIVAQNPSYIIFEPPRYFSSHNLKLTYKGSLETKEYIMDEIAKCLNLNPNRFSILATLLGNHILTDADLHEFRIQFPDAKKKKKPVTKLDPIMVKTTLNFVRNLESVDDLDQVAEMIFKNYKKSTKDLISKFKQSVQYYRSGTASGFLKYRPRPRSNQTPGVSKLGAVLPDQAPRPAQNQEGKQTAEQSGEGSPNKKDFKLPTVTTEILNIASERHQKGLMHPMVYQLLTQAEVKLPVTLEDEFSRDLPSYTDLYRPVRQTIYSVLFNLNKLKIVHENTYKEKGETAPARSFEVSVKEYMPMKANGRPVYKTVVARPVEWKVPSIERMWLGKNEEDKNRRLRAFLTIMHSDSNLILNTQYVPQHLLLMVCVLRYMMQYGQVLQRHELDAFIAMAVSPLLRDEQTMQDLKLPTIMGRGVQLASLFMSGVETALLANDVCGAPVPGSVCSPWLFFDGKLFHHKLLRANSNISLVDLCDGQMEQVMRLERLRQAVLENLHVDFAHPPLPFPFPYHDPYRAGPYGPPGPGPMYRDGRGDGPMGPALLPGGPRAAARGRGILGSCPLDNRGGHLEVAGTVVGSWRGREGPSPRGRGIMGASPVMGPPRNNPVYYTGRGFAPPMRGMYGMRGAMRGARLARRPPRVTVKPGRGRGNKAAASKGRGLTVDMSAVASSDGKKDVEQEEEEVYEDAEDDYADAEDEDEGEEEEEEETK